MPGAAPSTPEAIDAPTEGGATPGAIGVPSSGPMWALGATDVVKLPALAGLRVVDPFLVISPPRARGRSGHTGGPTPCVPRSEPRPADGERI